ncbi:MAG TPA: DUF2155 domain-containing protein [Roseomonas sp.]|jgi:hypothetical protein
MRAALFLAAALLAVPAVAQQDQGQPPQPPSQPQELLAPEAWVPGRVAHLQALDKVTARVTVLDATVGQEARFGTLSIRVAACNKRPADEVPDAAAFMEIADSRAAQGAAVVFRGWMFANAPGVNMLEHPVYDIRVLECR